MQTDANRCMWNHVKQRASYFIRPKRTISNLRDVGRSRSMWLCMMLGLAAFINQPGLQESLFQILEVMFQPRRCAAVSMTQGLRDLNCHMPPISPSLSLSLRLLVAPAMPITSYNPQSFQIFQISLLSALQLLDPEPLQHGLWSLEPGTALFIFHLTARSPMNSGWCVRVLGLDAHWNKKSAASWLQTSNYRDTSCLIWSAWTRASESKSNSNLCKLGRAGHAMPSRRLIFHVIPPQPGLLLLEPTRSVQWLILAGLRQQTSHPNIYI